MVEFSECASDVAGHGDVDISLVVLPIEGETAVEVAGQVDSHVIVGSDSVDEMHGVGFGEIFHAEVVDAESECGALRVMAPEAWGERHPWVRIRQVSISGRAG